MLTTWNLTPRKRVIMSLIGLTITSGVLYLAGAVENQSLQFAYLPWNLLLSWLPFLIMVVLLRLLRSRAWTSWLPFSLTFLWLILLPNTFYMISDFIHIQEVARHNLLYDIVMFSSFIATAALIGFTTLHMVHHELRKRVGARDSAIMVSFILFLCSFAIYLGRDLRWNSWDVLLNPAGILFDVSDHLIHPFQHGAMFTTTVSFFVLLGGLYVFGWQLALAIRQDSSR